MSMRMPVNESLMRVNESWRFINEYPEVYLSVFHPYE